MQLLLERVAIALANDPAVGVKSLKTNHFLLVKFP